MEELFNHLKKIKELLEQIYTITQNQLTVLIDSRNNNAELEMIEEMANYKQEITLQVEEEEALFQNLYTRYKEELIEKQLMPSLQTKVGNILKLKEDIILNEQKNVLLLQEAMRQCVKCVKLPKDPSKVADAYKQNRKRF